jgi:dTDP-4-dehydrorhamnose reductase
MLNVAGHHVVRHGLVTESDLQVDVRVPFVVPDFNHPVDVVVNLVAATNVDRCESDLQWATSLNVDSVKNISDYVVRHGIRKYVHISTDHVYDGTGPHCENDVCPVNVYAKTKLTGEEFALEAGAVVLRTNFWGKSHNIGRISFSDWIHERLVARMQTSVFDDVFFSAVSMRSLSACIELVGCSPIPGIYNYGMLDRISKSDFAFRWARHYGLDESLLFGTSFKTTKFMAPRPFDMSLNSARFIETYNWHIPCFESELRASHNDYLKV